MIYFQCITRVSLFDKRPLIEREFFVRIEKLEIETGKSQEYIEQFYQMQFSMRRATRNKCFKTN